MSRGETVASVLVWLDTGLVCPRGDDGYPVLQRVYRRIGFERGPRVLTLTRTAERVTGVTLSPALGREGRGEPVRPARR